MSNSKVVAVFSDIHGNVRSLIRALKVAQSLGAEQFFCLGDVLGYIPSVSALEILMALPEPLQCIRGNHEENILKGNFNSNSEIVTNNRLISRMLSSEQRTTIASWSSRLEMELEGMKLLFVHGSPTDSIFGYVYPDTPLDFKNIANNFRFIFMGNTHRPFIRHLDRSTFVNVGSVGLPRDTSGLGSFAIFNISEQKVEIIQFPIDDFVHDIQLEFGEQIHSSVYALLKVAKFNYDAK